MNEFFELQMLGFFQGEGATILGILGMGAIYLLAPVMGYESTRRGPLIAAMWAMVLKIGIGLFRTSLLLINKNGGIMGSRGSNQPMFADFEQLLGMALILGEPLVFLGAMALFVYGLQKLRRRELVYRPAGGEGAPRSV